VLLVCRRRLHAMTPLPPVTLLAGGEAHHAAVHTQLQGPARQAAMGPPEALGPAEQAAVLLARAPCWLMASSLSLGQQQPRRTSMNLCLLEEDDPRSSFHLIPACGMAVVCTRERSQIRAFL
jgi:hypothetical protein